MTEHGQALTTGITIYLHQTMHIDEDTGLSEIIGEMNLLATYDSEGMRGSGLDRSATYADIKDLPIRLESLMLIADANGIRTRTGDDPIICSAHIRYRLFDLFSTILLHFSKPSFDPRYAKEVEEDSRFSEHLRKLAEERRKDQKRGEDQKSGDVH